MADPLLLGIEIGGTKLQLGLGRGDGALVDQRVDLAWGWTGGAQVTALEPLFPRIESIVEPTDGQ